jgi:hypothetical protein
MAQLMSEKEPDNVVTLKEGAASKRVETVSSQRLISCMGLATTLGNSRSGRKII